MAKATRSSKPRAVRDPDALFEARAKKTIPFEFVLDALAPLSPWTRPMFGCTSIYVDERILFILRDKDDDDSGVWVATDRTHHASLRKELRGMRGIEVLGGGDTNWQNLPKNLPQFEATVLKACALALAGDPRIGRIPKQKKKKPKA